MPTGYLAGLDPPTPMPRARPNIFADLIPQGQPGTAPGIFDDMLASPPSRTGLFDDIPAEGQSAAASQKPGMFDDIPVEPAGKSAIDFSDLIPGNTGGTIATQTQQTTPQHHFGLMDTWPVRLAKSVYDAVTLPHDVNAGTATVPESAQFSQALGGTGEDTSSIGRVTNLAALTMLPNDFGGPTKTAPPTTEQLKSAARAGYTAAKNTGIEIKPEALATFNAGLQSELAEDGLNAEVAPKTFGVLNKLSASPEDPTATVTAQNLHTIQKSLGVVKNSSIDPTERMTAGRALNEFNDFIGNLDPNSLAIGTPEDAAQYSALIKEANANYAASKQAENFDLRGEKAENNAAAAHSGMNLENNLRSQVRQILNNPKLQRGYDPDTLQAMKDFNAGSRSANILRMVGNAMGGGGGIGMLASGAIGHMLGLPFEAGPGVGLALKAMGNQRALSGFNNIGDMIRANSPLARSGVTSRTPASLTEFLGRALLPAPLESQMDFAQPPQ